MFKVTITNKYNLHEFHGGKYTLIGKFDKVNILKRYCETFLKDRIVLKEIDEAIKCMSDTNHNVAEFGIRGMFTVSYFDPKEE